MTEIFEVPSPFCGFGTDDLTIKVDGESLKVTENGCAVNTPAFEQPIEDISPRVNGSEVSLDEAIANASDLLKNTSQPIFGGCATDVNGMRALLSLADCTGAVVDHIHFNNTRRNILTMQDSGWMNTTLSEVKNRCDLLLIVGTDLEGFYPRFFERYFWDCESMFVEDNSKRKVIFLGKAPSGEASTSPDGRKAQVIECPEQDLADVVAVLRALLKGNQLMATEVGGIKMDVLNDLADQLKQATYGVVTWSAGDFSFPQSELTVQAICEMTKELNAETRFSGLPLGGREGDQTANQVCGWITGYPARIRFASGFPEYDPYLNDAGFFLSEGEADALLWVQAFNVHALPPRTDVPVIVLGRSGMTFEQEPDVFIPIGTPGIDHAGHAYRMDNVVAIRLKKLRDSGLPSTFEVLTAIEQGYLGN